MSDDYNAGVMAERAACVKYLDDRAAKVCHRASQCDDVHYAMELGALAWQFSVLASEIKLRSPVDAAIATSRWANETEYPVLDGMLSEYLEAGAEIRNQGGLWHLFDASGESLAAGKTISKMLVDLIFRRG